MSSVAWTRDGDLRVATLGDRSGRMLPAGSRFAWMVGHVSGLDDEDTARRNVEEMLTGQVSPPVVAAPAPAANESSSRAPELVRQPDALPTWAAVPGDDGRAVRRDWTAEQYHADARNGRSDLELFADDPNTYHAIKVARTMTRTPTAAMRRGTLLHLAVLEPAEFKRRVVIAPETDDDFKGKGGKARREAWKAELARWRASQPADAIVLDEDCKELAQVEGMARAIRTLQTPAAKAARALLFGPGETEVTITWRDEDPALAQPMDCKARLDRLLVRATGTLVVDLKSTDDASEDAFTWSIEKYGYHRQAAWYGHAAQALVGSSLPRFAFVVVNSEPPHTVAVYELEPEAIAIGAQEIRETLRALSRARAENDWTAPWERAVKKINLPYRARRKGEQALAAKET